VDDRDEGRGDGVLRAVGERHLVALALLLARDFLRASTFFLQSWQYFRGRPLGFGSTILVHSGSAQTVGARLDEVTNTLTANWYVSSLNTFGVTEPHVSVGGCRGSH